MTLNEICKVVETPAHHYTGQGHTALRKIDTMTKTIVEKLGKDFAKELVDTVGPGYEFEFYSLLEEYIKKDH